MNAPRSPVTARALVHGVEDERADRRKLYRSMCAAVCLATSDPARKQVLQLVANDIARSGSNREAIEDARASGFEVKFYIEPAGLGIEVSLSQEN